MTAVPNVHANSSAVIDRRYSHPESRSRGIEESRGETLHPPIVILSASEGPHLTRDVTQGTLAGTRPYVRSLSPSRTGVVFAVRDDERTAIERLFRESSFV